MPRNRRRNEPPSHLHDGLAFLASLEGSGCVKLDGDGAGQVRFSIPASEAQRLAKLAMDFRERALVVVVMPYRVEIDPNRT